MKVKKKETVMRFKLQRKEEKAILKQANAEITIDSKSIDVIKSKLALYLARGLDLEDAIKLTGCSKSTVSRLRADSQFEQFIQQAIATNESEYLGVIENNAVLEQQWQAAAWFLERRYPDKYGKRDIIRHEYQLKLQTFMKVIIDTINNADPKLRVEVVTKLREYNFDGTDLADRTFKPDNGGNTGATLLLPEPEDEED
jgi:hypothetical protein